jgi:hypothetical protein
MIVSPLPLNTQYLFYSPGFHYCLSLHSLGCLNVCPLRVCFILVCSFLSNILPYPFTSQPPHFLTVFDTQPHVLYLHILWYEYYWCSVILFSFLSFPKFHRVAPLLQIFSTIEFVYDHACFWVYVYLWIYLSHMRENICLLCFWSWLTSLNMVSSNCIHLPLNPMALFPVAE